MKKLRNLKLTIAYEGTTYAGFQRQMNALTVQAEIENAISKITAENVSIIGAGRTDAGVHAKGQVVNFSTGSQILEDKLLKAMNAVLPQDIVVISIAGARDDFHARFSAKSKTYSYRIYNHPIRPVFEKNFVFHYKYPLNIELLKNAAELLIGTQDFKSFQAVGTQVKTSVRTINFCYWEQTGAELKFFINADGFLYHMVRNIVGTLLLVGNCQLNLDQFQAVIKAQDRSLAGPTAPALGLCLEEIFY